MKYVPKNRAEHRGNPPTLHRAVVWVQKGMGR